MSWEAYRWTAKSPSELYHVLGPHGVDELVRQSLAAIWRDLPEEARTLPAAIAKAREVQAHNFGVWKNIKQPTPEAFFANLRPTNADGHFRQAMVLCWMMMPRLGGRVVGDALRIVSEIFERNITAWETDNDTFTGKKKRPASARKPKPAAKPPAAKAPAVKPATGKPKAGPRNKAGTAKKPPAKRKK